MTIARVYYAPFVQSVTNSSDQNVWQIETASTKKAILHGFSLTSPYTTDERVVLTLRRYSTIGSGGSTITVEPADEDNAITQASAVRALVTTPGTDGDIIGQWTWSQQGELLYLPTPEIRPVVKVSSFLGLHLGTAMGATRAWSGWVAFEEL